MPMSILLVVYLRYEVSFNKPSFISIQVGLFKIKIVSLISTGMSPSCEVRIIFLVSLPASKRLKGKARVIFMTPQNVYL